MICLGPCDLQNVHSCWCHASQMRISPQKKKREMMKAFSSAQLAGRDRGEGVGEKERVHAASHSYFSSVFGASAGSLYFISFSPLPVSSHPLCCFPSHQPSLPPSPTPYPSLSCLSASPRGLIYGCEAPETAMTTHAFLCFVSSLAYWLALWLTACTCCVSALYSCHAVSLLPQSKNVSLFLFVWFVAVVQGVSCYSCKHAEHIS